MSTETWIKEFCPVAAKSMTRRSALAVVKRDLRKWEGLTKRNLKGHGLVRDNFEIHDGLGGSFFMDADSCALCTKYDMECGGCALSIVRGNVDCISVRPKEKFSPYTWFVDHGNPKFMLYWLRRAKKMLEASQ